MKSNQNSLAGMKRINKTRMESLISLGGGNYSVACYEFIQSIGGLNPLDYMSYRTFIRIINIKKCDPECCSYGKDEYVFIDSEKNQDKINEITKILEEKENQGRYSVASMKILQIIGVKPASVMVQRTFTRIKNL